MKTKSTLLAVASITALLTGCVYDDGSGYYNNYQTSPVVYYPQSQQQYNQPRVYRTTTRYNSQGSYCNNSQNNGYYQQNNGYYQQNNGYNNGYYQQNNGYNNRYNSQNNGYYQQNNGYYQQNNGYNNRYNSQNNGSAEQIVGLISVLLR